jgi:hypothetical protein
MLKQATTIGLVMLLGACAQANAGAAEAPHTSVLASAHPAMFAAAPASEGSVLHARRYYRTPPPPRARRSRGIQGWMTVRGGVFDSDDVSKDDWTLGLKAVGNVAPTLRLGGSVDLMRRTNSERTVITEYVDATGHTVRSEATTGESESNLVPLLAIAEFVLPAPGIQPYFGVGGGWQFLNVRALDYEEGYEYEADYDGPGWQAWVGADFEVAPRVRLNAEVFHNEATVERRVYDPFDGVAYDERIELGGNGGRFGLSFAF